MQKRRNRDSSLDNIFKGLLCLHKALLGDERVAYERVHGRIPSNGAFLQLGLNDAWFAWLRPLSHRSPSLMNLSESDDTASREAIPALLASVQMLLMPMEDGERFSRQYHDVLQRSPDVVLTHAAVRPLLMQSIPHKR